MDSARNYENVRIVSLGREHADDLARFVQRLRGSGCGAITAPTSDGWIAGCFLDHCLRGFVEIQNLEHPCLWSAFLLVEAPWRGIGLGTRLLAAAVSFANASGRSTLRLTFRRHNWPMRKLASKAHARFDLRLDELSADINLLTELRTSTTLRRRGSNDD
jgi:GNAT superfamily N-acetyltransferase